MTQASACAILPLRSASPSVQPTAFCPSWSKRATCCVSDRAGGTATRSSLSFPCGIPSFRSGRSGTCSKSCRRARQVAKSAGSWQASGVALGRWSGQLRHSHRSSRLSPIAGGLEGFVLLYEQPPLAELSLTEGENEADLHIDLDPALLPPATVSGGDEHLVARSRSNLQDLDSIVIPLFWPDRKGFQDPAVSMLLARNARQLGGLGYDDVFVAEPQDALEVAPVERGKGVADDLHVLLRHRRRSISRRVAPCDAKRLGAAPARLRGAVLDYLSNSLFYSLQPYRVRAVAERNWLIMDEGRASALAALCESIVPGSKRVEPAVYIDAKLAMVDEGTRAAALGAIDTLADEGAEGLAERAATPEFLMVRALAIEAYYSDFVAPGAEGPGAWEEIDFRFPLASQVKHEWSYLGVPG